MTHVLSMIGRHELVARGHGRPASDSWLGRLVQRLQDAATRRRLYRETVNELAALSDRELDDIGIVRCDIGLIARQSVERVHEPR